MKYEHLGKEVGYREVMRVRKILVDKIAALMDSPEADSPLFLFIPSLRAASLATANIKAAGKEAAQPAPSSEPTDKSSFAELLESFRLTKATAEKAEDWAAPVQLLKRLKTMQPDDPFIVQQLTLATYKYQQPDKRSSLVEAKSILEKLAPRMSSDAETVGLWGAIHKRLWDELKNREDLEEALRAYGRGYYIKNDYYNGINYAFMLDVRASCSAGDDATADRVLARRTRQDVLTICDRLLESSQASGKQEPGHSDPGVGSEEPFWIGATKVEALLGLGRKDEAQSLKAEVIAKERARLVRSVGAGDKASKEGDWKENSLNTQFRKLDELLPH